MITARTDGNVLAQRRPGGAVRRPPLPKKRVLARARVLKVVLAMMALLRKQTQRVVTEDGAYTTNLYIGTTDLIARPDLYHVEKPRNHGGERLLCPHCQSDRLQKKVTITCMDCGAVLDERSSQVNKEEADEPGIPGTVMREIGQAANSDQADFFASEQDSLMTNRTRNQGGQVADPGEQGTPGGESVREPTSPPGHAPSDDPGQQGTRQIG